MIPEDEEFRTSLAAQESEPLPDLLPSIDLSGIGGFEKKAKKKKKQKREAIDEEDLVAKRIVARERKFEDIIKRSNDLLSRPVPSARISEDTMHYLKYKSPWAAIRNHDPLEHLMQARSILDNTTASSEGKQIN